MTQTARTAHARTPQIVHLFNPRMIVNSRIMAQRSKTISAYDPKAVEKLEERVKIFRAEQTYMKNLNSYYRKNGTCIGFSDLSFERARQLDHKCRTRNQTAPFSKYELRNINDRIKNTEVRIMELIFLNSIVEKTVTFQGGQFIIGSTNNRIKIYFDNTPDEEMLEKLKLRGFRKTKNNKIWQRQRTKQAIWAAYAVADLKIQSYGEY